MKKQNGISAVNIGKLPPQNIDAEKAILGAIMVQKDAIETISGILKADHFYREDHSLIYKTILDLYNRSEPIDIVTVVQELQRLGVLEKVGGAFGVTSLTSSMVSAAHIEAHSKIVFENYLRRKLIEISARAVTCSYDQGEDIFETLNEFESDIINLTTSGSDLGMTHIREVTKEGVTTINKAVTEKREITGVESGFYDLDITTRGWQPGDFILLGARPSVGKTAMALNLVRNAAKRKKKVAVWSLEMKSMFLFFRMLASDSGVSLSKIQRGKLSEEELNGLSKSTADLSNLPIWFDQATSTSVASIKRKARMLKKKEGLDLIVIDYLQLMDPEDERVIREQQVSKISRGLKKLALELNIPIIALSQLSRDSEKYISWDNGPQVSTLRESGAIEQDADLIIMLWGATKEEMLKDSSLSTKRRIRICKQRNGVLRTIDLDFKDEIQLFESVNDAYTTPNNYGNFRPVKQLFDEDFNNDENPFQ